PSYHTLFFCGATMAEQEEADAGGMCFFKAGVPHFTLVLWFKPFREGKLRLPKGFTKEHGAELANEVLFKLPNGAEWQVSVVRGRKRIWFVKGWREFAEFYCLKPSNYLVFGLASRNSLNVLIFDTTLTATEIDYPNKKTNVIESEYDVASNEAVQRPSSSSPKATAKLSLKLHKLRRKNVEGRTASGEELDSNDKQGNTSLATESDSTCRPNKHDHSTKTRDKPSLGSIQPHKLRRTDGMDGTASSSKGQNRGRTPHGKTSSIPTEEAGPFSFANDNSLRVGDVCVFELVECCTEPRLNVTIFRASQDGHSHGNTGDQWKRSLAAAFEAANTFTSNQPFFKTAVTTACLKCRQVVCEVSVNRYEADLEKRRTVRVFIIGGWGEFVEGNYPVPGDVFVFELIKGEHEEDADAIGLVMTVTCVHIFRG
ncbi:B3 domain-containing protein At4g01580, partial [Linum perenne]